MGKGKKFLFETKQPKPEKLPGMPKPVKDFRQKQADAGLKRTNLYLLGLAGALGAALLIITLIKNVVLNG